MTAPFAPTWRRVSSGDSKGGVGWAIAPQTFVCPPSFFLKFPVQVRLVDIYSR